MEKIVNFQYHVETLFDWSFCSEKKLTVRKSETIELTEQLFE